MAEAPSSLNTVRRIRACESEAPAQLVLEKFAMSYAVEQRMRFIDFLLHQYGTINRSALTDYFGISSQQATNDMNAYRELAPTNVAYDLGGKTYRRTTEFRRVWP